MVKANIINRNKAIQKINQVMLGEASIPANIGKGLE